MLPGVKVDADGVQDPPGSAQLGSGTRLGRYRIESVLGQGQMGVVYRARADDESVVALKVLKPELARDDTYRRRFRREGDVAARLDHPNLVAVLDRGRERGLLFLVSPYVDGETLSARLATRRLEPRALARIVADIGAGLDHLHRHGLVHRDVKPSNVLVDAAGRALLTDFGVARGQAHSVLTAAGRVVGTADYLAPEVIRGERAGPAADLYSLGCLAYEAAVGRPPFRDRPTLGEVCVAHLREPPSPPRSLRPDLSPAFSDALLTVLAKDPAARPRTGAAYGRLLRAAARGA